MTNRVMSRDLKPGTKLRWTGSPSSGRPEIATLARRKSPDEHLRSVPFAPGWWCEDAGGLADYVIDDPDSKWEIIDDAGSRTLEVDGLEHRLIAALATASAVAVANGKWAREAERRLALAEGIVTELRHVWPLLRGCAHDFDPECARCQWLRPLTEALQTVDSSSGPAAHSEDGQVQHG